MPNHPPSPHHQTNLQKLLLFTSLSDQDLPLIPPVFTPHSSLHLSTELRMYLNDEELLVTTVSLRGESYLPTEGFVVMVGEVLKGFLQEGERRGQGGISRRGIIRGGRGFVEFIEEWLQRDEAVRVEYAVYEEVVNRAVQGYKDYLYRTVAFNVNKKEKQLIIEKHSNKKKNQIEPKSLGSSSPSLLNLQASLANKPSLTQSSVNKPSKTSPHLPPLITTHPQHSLSPSNLPSTLPSNLPCTLTHSPSTFPQPPNPFPFYLRQFFTHYCRHQSANPLLTHEFHHLSNFYTTLNLTKFIAYCKDLKLLKAQKTITVKFIQSVFVKYCDHQKGRMAYDGFQLAVKEIVGMVFTGGKQEGEGNVEKEGSVKENLQEKGWQLIGVNNRTNFVQKMKSIGVNLPLNKVVFKRDNKKEKVEDNKKVEEIVKVDMKTGNVNGIDEKKEYIGINSEQKQNTQTKPYLKNGGYSYGYDYGNGYTNKPQSPSLPLIKPLPIDSTSPNPITNSPTNHPPTNHSLKPLKPLHSSSSIPSTSNLLTILSPKPHTSTHHHNNNLKQFLQMDLEDDDPYLHRHNRSGNNLISNNVREGVMVIKANEEKQNDKGREKDDNDKEKGDKYSCGQGLMQRIDRRIENVVKKIR